MEGLGLECVKQVQGSRAAGFKRLRLRGTGVCGSEGEPGLTASCRSPWHEMASCFCRNKLLCGTTDISSYHIFTPSDKSLKAPETLTLDPVNSETTQPATFPKPSEKLLITRSGGLGYGLRVFRPASVSRKFGGCFDAELSACRAKWHQDQKERELERDASQQKAQVLAAAERVCDLAGPPTVQLRQVLYRIFVPRDSNIP